MLNPFWPNFNQDVAKVEKKIFLLKMDSPLYFSKLADLSFSLTSPPPPPFLESVQGQLAQRPPSPPPPPGCVDAVLRLLGVFHDVLYGDVAPVRPGSTLGVVSVRLSRSLFVPGRHLKKGGSPPFPPALGSHTRVATKRRVGFRSPASHTRVATARAERDAPTPMCDFFFFVVVFFFFFFF